MPKIDLDFEGRVMCVNVTEAYDKDGYFVYVSQMSIYELLHKLDAGELRVSFKYCVANSTDYSVRVTATYPSRSNYEH